MANLQNVGKSLRWIAACAVLVGGFEGLSTVAYHDTLAHGLPTVCYGETEGVKMGDHYTKQQCLDMLAAKLPRYWYEIEPFIHVTLSDNEKIAYTSFAYNVGSGAVIRSSFLKKLNAGDHVGACVGMLAYDRSMGEVRKGLDNRRRKEAQVCLTIDQAGPVQVIVPIRTTAETPASGGTQGSSGSEITHQQAPHGIASQKVAPKAAASLPKPAPKPYVCTSRQAEAGECLPLLDRSTLKPKYAPEPPKPKLVCTQFLFWRTCH